MFRTFLSRTLHVRTFLEKPFDRCFKSLSHTAKGSFDQLYLRIQDGLILAWNWVFLTWVHRCTCPAAGRLLDLWSSSDSRSIWSWTCWWRPAQRSPSSSASSPTCTWRCWQRSGIDKIGIAFPAGLKQFWQQLVSVHFCLRLKMALNSSIGCYH